MDTLQFSVRIRYAVLILGTLISAAIAFAVFKSTDVEKFKTVISLFTGGLTLTALIYTSMSFNYNLKINENTLFNSKKVFSFSLISEWGSPQMAKYVVIASELRKKAKNVPPAEIALLIDKDGDQMAALFSVLNFFEKVALSIQSNVSDEGILKDFFSGLFNQYYLAFKGYIDHYRTQLDNPDFFIRFYEISAKWNA